MIPDASVTPEITERAEAHIYRLETGEPCRRCKHGGSRHFNTPPAPNGFTRYACADCDCEDMAQGPHSDELSDHELHQRSARLIRDLLTYFTSNIRGT